MTACDHDFQWDPFQWDTCGRTQCEKCGLTPGQARARDEADRLISEIEHVRAQQRAMYTLITDTTIQRMKGARGMLSNAIEHAERALEEGATADQIRSRRSQAASALARALMLLAEASGHMAMEMWENESFSTRKRR